MYEKCAHFFVHRSPRASVLDAHRLVDARGGVALLVAAHVEDHLDAVLLADGGLGRHVGIGVPVATVAEDDSVVGVALRDRCDRGADRTVGVDGHHGVVDDAEGLHDAESILFVQDDLALLELLLCVVVDDVFIDDVFIVDDVCNC